MEREVVHLHLDPTDLRQIAIADEADAHRIASVPRVLVQSGAVSTLVAFHAHPDDEALLTAGTMSKAAAEGHRVVLVVATHGEAGDVDLTFLGDDDLGERRTRETEASARAIGVHRLVFLGFADSGDEGLNPGGFAYADVDDAAHRLADILREERADVLLGYDERGGYGHPDHVQVHRVGRRAADLAGTPVYLEATVDRDLLQLASEVAPTLGFELPEAFAPPDLSEWFVPASEITHKIDVSAFLAAKRASMRAHASQTTSASSNVRTLEVFASLPDDLFALAFGTEWFVDPTLAAESEIDDVFATLDRHG
jgi:LmbE family N-acetylglucosaminyl deacetylase